MNNVNLASRCPAVLKKLVPFFTRARDFATRDPQVAYYCKSYAAQLGIGLLGNVDPAAKDEATAFLMELMDHLETEKADPTVSGGDGKEILLKSAYLIFKRADDRERSGQADKTCIAMFTTSSVLMEATKQFGDMTPDVQEKYTYARYTAMQIKKALDSNEPYISPNPPLQSDDVQMEDASHVDPMASQLPPAQPEVAMPPPPPPVEVPASATNVPSVPTPPAAPPADDFDALLAQLQSGGGTPSPEPEAQLGHDRSDSMDLMEERLRNLGGLGGTQQPTSAPEENIDLLKAEAQLNRSRADELENEVVKLKRMLVASQTETQQAKQQCQKYEQALQLMKQQMAHSGSGGGSGGVVVPVMGFEPTLNEMTDGQKYAKYVISALQFKDVVTARENLIKSMSIINGHPLPK